MYGQTEDGKKRRYEGTRPVSIHLFFELIHIHDSFWKPMNWLDKKWATLASIEKQ